VPWTKSWRPPEVFLEHRRGKVYRCYKDGDASKPCGDWFTTNENATGDPDDDVWSFHTQATTDGGRREEIIAEIELGCIDWPGDRKGAK
jgi:hypothetical protein